MRTCQSHLPHFRYQWFGAFRLRDYLETVSEPDHIWPPEDATNGIYVVSTKPWTGVPTENDGILYVGGNREDDSCFYDRVIFVISESLGLYGGRHASRSKGGQSIFEHCCKHHLKPLNLYVGWAIGVPCRRCAERQAIEALKPVCNKNAAPRCDIH